MSPLPAGDRLGLSGGAKRAETALPSPSTSPVPPDNPLRSIAEEAEPQPQPPAPAEEEKAAAEAAAAAEAEAAAAAEAGSAGAGIAEAGSAEPLRSPPPQVVSIP